MEPSQALPEIAPTAGGRGRSSQGDNEEDDCDGIGAHSNASSANKRHRGGTRSLRRGSSSFNEDGDDAEVVAVDDGDTEERQQQQQGAPMRGGHRAEYRAAAAAVDVASSSSSSSSEGDSSDIDEVEFFDAEEGEDADDDNADEEEHDDDDEEDDDDDEEGDDDDDDYDQYDNQILRAAQLRARINDMIRDGVLPGARPPPRSRSWVQMGAPAAEKHSPLLPPPAVGAAAAGAVAAPLPPFNAPPAVATHEGSAQECPPASSAHHAAGTMMRLPQETFHNVLMFLHAKDIVRSMSPVSRHFYHFCRSRMLWRNLTRRCFPQLSQCLEKYASLVLRRKAKLQQDQHEGIVEAAHAPVLLPPPRNLRDENGFDLGLRCDEVKGTCYIANCVMDRHVVHNLPSICAASGPYSLVASGPRPPPLVSQCALVKAIRWEDAFHNLPYLSRLLVCDQRNNRIKRMRMDGTVLAVFDEGNNVEIATPSGITLIPDGTVAITEFGLSTVAILDINCLAPRVVRRFEVGYLPRGMATLPDGNLIVCMFGESLVKVFVPSSGELVFTVPMRFSGPSGIAVLPDGQLAITECNGNRVSIIKLTPNDRVVISELALRNGLGGAYIARLVAVYGSGDYSDDSANFSEPRGVTYLPKEANGHAIAVCDSGNSRIKIIDFRTGIVLRMIYANFQCVASIAVLPDGHHAVVSDCDHHRLLVIKMATSEILLQLGTGEAGDEPDEFCCPRCLVVLPGLV